MTYKSVPDPNASADIRRAVDHLFAQGTDAFLLDIEMMMYDWEACLPGRRFSLHMIHGELDRNFPASSVREFVKRYPDITLETVSTAGELLHFQAPEIVANALIRTAQSVQTA